MQIQKVNSQNFNGNFSRNAAQIIKNQGHHIWTQGLSFVACNVLVPIDSFEKFIHTKLLIDLGEYISNLVIENPNTTARQFTNTFSALTDCSKDVIRWGKALVDKINRR